MGVVRGGVAGVRGFAKGIRCTPENGLSAIVVAAGPRAIPRLAGIGAVDAQLVSVVGIGRVVPRAVVEVTVVVGDLGAAHPVDGDPSVGTGEGGAGVVAGIDGCGATDDLKAIAVGLYVGVAGGGSVLDEGVVVRRCRTTWRYVWWTIGTGAGTGHGRRARWG